MSVFFGVCLAREALRRFGVKPSFDSQTPTYDTLLRVCRTFVDMTNEFSWTDNLLCFRAALLKLCSVHHVQRRDLVLSLLLRTLSLLICGDRRYLCARLDMHGITSSYDWGQS